MRAMLIAAIAITVFVAYGLINNAWYHVLAVRGGSMEPAITAGDLIIISRPPEQVEVGQVLTLQVDGSIVTHRVVEVRPDGTFVTQGDANDTRDDFTANDVHVVGEFRFSLPLIGMLIEPIITGAWFNDGGSASMLAGSGSWEPEAIMWSGAGITWSPPSEEPSPSPSAASTEGPDDSTPADASPSSSPSTDEMSLGGSGGPSAPPEGQPSPGEVAPSEAPGASEEAAPSEATPSEESAPSEEASQSEEAAPSEGPPSEEASPSAEP